MTKYIVGFLAALLIVAGVHFAFSNFSSEDTAMAQDLSKLKIATFAGGCFWCTESDFEKVDGVAEVISGYTGGDQPNPTYKQVSAGGTGHIESVQVYYDPDKVTYKELLDVFWRHVNPTDPGGQFVDRGNQYVSAIFYNDMEEKRMAEESKAALEKAMKFEKPIVTEIRPLKKFYKAEEYHQNYYRKNPLRYGFYRKNSGRDQYLEKTWGMDTMKSHKKDDSMDSGMMEKTSQKKYTKPSHDALERKLTRLQYKVTQQEGTEPPFNNAYWDNKEPGIYVDIVSGEPLFSSTDKYKSGTGWPSFIRPLVSENVVEKEDNSLFMKRVEVRSKHGDSHLGHVFEDGPQPTGLRYCINSASLRFIPANKLEEEGYGEFKKLF